MKLLQKIADRVAESFIARKVVNSQMPKSDLEAMRNFNRALRERETQAAMRTGHQLSDEEKDRLYNDLAAEMPEAIKAFGVEADGMDFIMEKGRRGERLI